MKTIDVLFYEGLALRPLKGYAVYAEMFGEICLLIALRIVNQVFRVGTHRVKYANVLI